MALDFWPPVERSIAAGRYPMGRVYKRGQIWWIQYYSRGELFRESSRSSLKAVATSLLRKREGNIADGRLPALQAEKTTFETLKDLYLQDYQVNGKKSLRRARQLANQLLKDFAEIKAFHITSQRVGDYILRRQKDGAANGTINRELAALKRMFRLASQQTPPLVLATPYIPHLHENNVRTGFFTEDEYKVLRTALPDHIKVPFIIAYWTGMRASEILGLRWEQIELDVGFARLQSGMTKNGRGRVIPLSNEVHRVLWLWRQLTVRYHPDCQWVCHYRGSPLRGIPRKRWRHMCDRVGLRGKMFHDLRRTAIRNLLRAGVSERVAMEISGHRTRSIFDRYDIVSDGDLRKAKLLLDNASANYTSSLQIGPWTSNTLESTNV